MIISLSDADAKRCGNKAFQLGRMIAAGLPVARGFCLPVRHYLAALCQPLPQQDIPLSSVAEQCAALDAALATWRPDARVQRCLGEALAALGGPVVVRSSSTAEDRLGQSAAGLFHSSLQVHQLDACLRAVRKTWASLWQPAAWALLRCYGSWPGAEKMAVLIQREIACQVSGIAHSEANAAQLPDHIYLEFVEGRGDRLADGSADPLRLWLPRAGDVSLADGLRFDTPQLGRLRSLILSAEECLGQKVQVEWAFDGQQFWLHQARPQPQSLDRVSDTGGKFAAAKPSAKPAPKPAVDLSDGPVWRWDSEHNPEPLSPAHAELISCLDAQYKTDHGLPVDGGALFKIIDGYLFEAEAPVGESLGRPSDDEAFDLEKYCERLAEVQARGTQLEVVDEAFQGFVRFYFQYRAQGYQSYGRAFAALRSFVEANLLAVAEVDLFDLAIADEHLGLRATRELYRLVDGSAQADGALLAMQRQRFLDRYGDLFLRWDIAAPTLGETTDSLWRLAQRFPVVEPLEGHRLAAERSLQTFERLRHALSVEKRDEFETRTLALRRARQRGEDDDLDFSRALAPLRRAYLHLAEALVQRGALAEVGQVFFLTRCELRSSEIALQNIVDQRQKESAAQLTRRPPHRVQGGNALRPSGSLWAANDGPLLRGIGVGGSAEGVVMQLGADDDLLTRDFSGKVLVCKTLIPCLALVLPQLAALISDHGGALSHAASLAREFSIPAVVGTQQATQVLKTGDRVWVDGENGRVIRL